MLWTNPDGYPVIETAISKGNKCHRCAQAAKTKINSDQNNGFIRKSVLFQHIQAPFLTTASCFHPLQVHRTFHTFLLHPHIPANNTRIRICTAKIIVSGGIPSIKQRFCRILTRRQHRLKIRFLKILPWWTFRTGDSKSKGVIWRFGTPTWGLPKPPEGKN